jgi:hypothetical protein
MMDCTAARRRMLEADPADLAPGAGSELAAHLATCASCRVAAAAILTGERGLRDWLAASAPPGDTAAAVERAARQARARRRMRSRLTGAAGALAAAAVAAGLLLLPRAPTPPSASPAARAAGAPGFSVTAPPGRDLIVLHPADSTIVIVWFVPSRRSS